MLGETETAGFLLVFARIAAWAQAAPLLGDPIIPARIRALVAACIAFPLAVLHPADFADLGRLPFEVLFGLLAGASARLVLAGAEAGGQLIGMQLGLGFAGTYDAMSQEESLPTRRIAYSLAALAFLAAGGFEDAVRVLALPLPGTGELLRDPMIGLVQTGGEVLALGARLAAPLLIAGIVANATMAFASKAAPSLNVFSVMLALFLVVGGAVLFATASLTAQDLEQIAMLAKQAVWRFE